MGDAHRKPRRLPLPPKPNGEAPPNRGGHRDRTPRGAIAPTGREPAMPMATEQCRRAQLSSRSRSWRCNGAGRAGATARAIVPRPGPPRLDLGGRDSEASGSVTAAWRTRPSCWRTCEGLQTTYGRSLSKRPARSSPTAAYVSRSDALGRRPVARGRAVGFRRLLNRRADAAVSPSRRRRCC